MNKLRSLYIIIMNVLFTRHVTLAIVAHIFIIRAHFVASKIQIIDWLIYQTVTFFVKQHYFL